MEIINDIPNMRIKPNGKTYCIMLNIDQTLAARLAALIKSYPTPTPNTSHIVVNLIKKGLKYDHEDKR